MSLNSAELADLDQFGKASSGVFLITPTQMRDINPTMINNGAAQWRQLGRIGIAPRQSSKICASAWECASTSPGRINRSPQSIT